jgi:hypothetical protein
MSRSTEIVKLLAEDLEAGILNITDKDLPKREVKREIDKIREEAFKTERAPEAEFALRLFRRYADLAEHLKARAADSSRTPTSLIGDVPSFLYEATTEDLPSGMSAFQHNKFWLRAVVCLFCFLCYVIMSTVPNISSTRCGRSLAVRRCRLVPHPPSTCPLGKKGCTPTTPSSRAAPAAPSTATSTS